MVSGITQFMPHGSCYLWNARLVWLHAVSDGLIALAYTSIPLTLVYFVRKRRDIPFHWMFICFGAFIIACGLTHALEVWNLWHTNYWLSGWSKAVTALASISTAILLVRLVPSAAAVPRPEQLRREIAARKMAETSARDLLEAAPDATVVVNREGVIVLVNAQTENLFGYRRQELLGKDAQMLVPERFRPEHLKIRESFLHQPRVFPMGMEREFYGLREDGSEFPFEIRLGPLHTTDGVLVICSIRDITRRKRAEQALQGVSTQLMRIQDEERRRLGRELHDSAGQSLALLKLRLDLLLADGELSPNVLKSLGECVHLATDAIDEVRSTSYELYPPMLEEMGLRYAIPCFLEGFAQRSGVRTSLDSPSEFDRPPREVELALFRVLQESLTNVRRHSGSDSAHVRLGCEDGAASLEVSDEGKGIPPEIMEALRSESPGNLGVGLRGMKERIRQLGGKLEVTSDGHGTRVSALIPMKKNC